MSDCLYQASVPVMLRYLGRLQGLLDAAQAHAQGAGRAIDDLLQARLAPDMLPLATQVVIAANFGLRTCFPLAGQAVPDYGAFADDSDGLRARLAHVTARLQALSPQQFEAADERTLTSQAGEARVALPAPDFLFQYALPNFFFHLGTAYAILRAQGVPLGKQDFDGFHAYPKAP